MKITSSLMHCSFYGMGDILLLTKSLVMREECDCHPHKSQWNLAAKWATSQQCNTVTMQDSNSTRELITVQACKACTLPEQRSLWGARSRDGEIIAAWSTDLSSASWSRCNKTIKLLFPLSTDFLTAQCFSGWFISLDDLSKSSTTDHPRGLTCICFASLLAWEIYKCRLNTFGRQAFSSCYSQSLAIF